MGKNNLKELGIDDYRRDKFIIVLYSKWCSSCKILFQILQKFCDEGLINLKQIEIGQDCKIAQKMDINVVPALIFFKDGELLNKNLKLYGQPLVNQGVLIGSFNEEIIEELINQM